MPLTAAPDAELVRQAQNGDIDAFEQLVERYSDPAFRAAFLIVGIAADAEDACQEAFFKAHRALNTYRPELPLRPWLLRIVVNEARNRRRGRSRRPETELGASYPDQGPGGEDPAEAAVSADRRARLMRAVDAMPGDDREVVVCRFFMDLSVEETARVLSCAEGTVKSRLHRALRRVREVIEDPDA
jgi:RNA polymerase sigma factor (sigma-70 family)